MTAWEQVLGDAPAPCLRVDEDGKVLWANLQAAQFFGAHSQESLKGALLWQFVRHNQRAECREMFSKGGPSENISAFFTMAVDDAHYIPAKLFAPSLSSTEGY